MKRLIIAICTILVILGMVACGSNKGSFTLVNNAEEPIAKAVLIVSGQTVEFRDILPDDHATASYQIKFDSHYDVRIVFRSGKELHKEVGYVTSGFDFQHEIVVTDIDIEILDSKIKANITN